MNDDAISDRMRRAVERVSGAEIGDVVPTRWVLDAVRAYLDEEDHTDLIGITVNLYNQLLSQHLETSPPEEAARNALISTASLTFAFGIEWQRDRE